MPFESDRDRYRSTKPQAESTDAELDALMPELFFAPPPQHTAADDPPIEEFNQEFEGLELNLPFEHYDDFLTALYGTTPVISTPSTLTYSTSDSIHEATSSHYSSDLTVSSDYLSYHSSNDGLYCGADDSIHPAIFSNDPPSIPLCPAEAHFDFGTSDSKPDSFGILPEDLATAIQPPSVALTPLSVHVTPTSETPDPDKPFICPHCPQTSSRSYNMKKHIEARHDKLKPFKCDTCGSEFTRRNDLDRHCRNPGIHRKKTSRRRFDPLRHRITVNEDPRLTMSAYADPTVEFKPAIDVSEDIMAWQEGV